METLRVEGDGVTSDYAYVTAPSSPGRCRAEFFFSVPSSPIRCAIPLGQGQGQDRGVMQHDQGSISAVSEFEFSARFSDLQGTSVSTADELFLNGQIRPVTKLSASAHQCSGPSEMDDSALKENQRGRDRSWIQGSRRRTRSLSPLRSFSRWLEESTKLEEEQEEEEEHEEDKINNKAGEACTKSVRSLKVRWSLKDFLYRSKSEGRGRAKDKLWGLSFSKPSAERAAPTTTNNNNNNSVVSAKKALCANGNGSCKGGVIGRPRVPPSPHELHYTANRAQAEELKRRTFLPYRQGLLGCLGFPSRSYSVAIDGFPKPVNAFGRR